MLEVLSGTDIDTPAARTETGAEMRRTVTETPAQFARAVRRIGEMYVELVRNGTAWGLYLSDMTPVRHTTRDLWATAVSAPSVEWQRTPDGCLVWCEWTEPTP